MSNGEYPNIYHYQKMLDMVSLLGQQESDEEANTLIVDDALGYFFTHFRWMPEDDWLCIDYIETVFSVGSLDTLRVIEENLDTMPPSAFIVCLMRYVIYVQGAVINVSNIKNFKEFNRRGDDLLSVLTMKNKNDYLDKIKERYIHRINLDDFGVKNDTD
jgi:hypothetical protein